MERWTRAVLADERVDYPGPEDADDALDLARVANQAASDLWEALLCQETAAEYYVAEGLRQKRPIGEILADVEGTEEYMRLDPYLDHRVEVRAALVLALTRRVEDDLSRRAPKSTEIQVEGEPGDVLVSIISLDPDGAKVAYRYEDSGQDGEWELGDIGDAVDLAVETAERLLANEREERAVRSEL
jgi:hypothetical protein